ncbi:MAG: hypothetical protein H7A23_05495 [Leptospiraceae bacterium]|nr:hypothetical protein [Leptospiraceae bacterium]
MKEEVLFCEQSSSGEEEDCKQKVDVDLMVFESGWWKPTALGDLGEILWKKMS